MNDQPVSQSSPIKAEPMIRTLPDGRVVEHVGTTLVERLEGRSIYHEHVLIDGKLTAIRVEFTDDEVAAASVNAG